MESIPTDTHIRNLLDPLDPEALFVPFRHAYGGLAEAGVLERFKVGGKLLVALDGTQYFTSEALCCPNCTRHEIRAKRE
jgi:hypothetical protein